MFPSRIHWWQFNSKSESIIICDLILLIQKTVFPHMGCFLHFNFNFFLSIQNLCWLKFFFSPFFYFKFCLYSFVYILKMVVSCWLYYLVNFLNHFLLGCNLNLNLSLRTQKKECDFRLQDSLEIMSDLPQLKRQLSKVPRCRLWKGRSLSSNYSSWDLLAMCQVPNTELSPFCTIGLVVYTPLYCEH